MIDVQYVNGSAQKQRAKCLTKLSILFPLMGIPFLCGKGIRERIPQTAKVDTDFVRYCENMVVL